MQSLKPASTTHPTLTLLRKSIPAFKALLGIGLLAATFWGVDWKAVSASFRAVRIEWIAAGLLCVLITLGMKFLRWVALLRSEGLRLNGARLWEAYFMGQAANILLPFRGGEVVRFSWAAAGIGPNSGILAASILLEKYLDLFGLTILSSFLFLRQPALEMLNSPLRLLLLIGCGILLVSFLWIGPWFWERQKQHLLRWKPLSSPRIEAEIRQLMSYFRIMRQPRRLFIILGMTGFIWLVMILTNVAVMEALEVFPIFDSATAALVLIYIGGIPALMPGNIGPFYFFASLGRKSVV